MKHIFTRILTIFALVVVSTTLAHAQATRTWVSGVGDDANPGSRTAPCKTFAGAISKTAAGGEIDALDPGGFGAVTITKAITIDGGGGQVASTLVSGTNGIVVQAGPTDVVILRRIRIKGLGTGINGIRFLSGAALIIDDCDIDGFTTNGVDVATSGGGQVTILNSRIMNCAGAAIGVTNTGGGRTYMSAKECSLTHCGTGVLDNQPSLSEVLSSRITGCGTGLLAQNGAGIHSVDNTISNNTTAINSQTSSSIVISNTRILSNNTGIATSINGVVRSMGNNENVGNATPGAPTSTFSFQ